MKASRAAARLLATWFGCGYVPFAPGTAGTLGSIPLYLLLRPFGHVPVAAASLAIAAVGVWASGVVSDELEMKDPQVVVIDEVAGVLLALSVAPASSAALVVGVVLFRIFDQTKPWPARAAERDLPRGWGIVLDDMAAGAWAAASLCLLHALGAV